MHLLGSSLMLAQMNLHPSAPAGRIQTTLRSDIKKKICLFVSLYYHYTTEIFFFFFMWDWVRRWCWHCLLLTFLQLGGAKSSTCNLLSGANRFRSAGNVKAFLKKSLTALRLKTCIQRWRLWEGRVVGSRGGACTPLMKRANSEGTVISAEPLLCGSTYRLFFRLPQHHLLHSHHLAACKQAVEMRETPFGMSDKHTFEMTCTFHALAWHKVHKCAVCRLHLGRVKDSQWPEAPGSLPNKLPVALNLQHTTQYCSHVYTHVSPCVCRNWSLI